LAPIKWQFKAGSNQLSLTALFPGQAQAAEAKVQLTLTVQSQGFVGSGSGTVSKDQWQRFVLVSKAMIQSGASQVAIQADRIEDFSLQLAPTNEDGRFFLSGHVGRIVVDAQKPFTHQLQFGFSCPISLTVFD
jgi:hypothetical protein